MKIFDLVRVESTRERGFLTLMDDDESELSGKFNVEFTGRGTAIYAEDELEIDDALNHLVSP